MTVFDFKKGETCVITSIGLDKGAAARLYSLGLKEGVKVSILAFSAFKSAVLIGFGAARVGIRRSLARKIEARA